MSLSKSALKNAANDFDGGHRYKRLLSISASTVNERRRIIQPIEDTYPHDVEIGRDCNSISLEDDIQGTLILFNIYHYGNLISCIIICRSFIYYKTVSAKLWKT